MRKEPKEDVTYKLLTVLRLLTVVFVWTQFFTALLLQLPVFWISTLLLPLLISPVLLFIKAEAQKKKKYLYYALAIQIISIFTISGVVLGFFGGLTWSQIEEDFNAPGNSTCTVKNALSIGRQYYLSGVFLYIISFLLFIFNQKCTWDWVKRIEEAEIGEKSLLKENIKVPEQPEDPWIRNIHQHTENGTLRRNLIISSLIQVYFGIFEVVAITFLTLPLMVTCLMALPLSMIPFFLMNIAINQKDKRLFFGSIVAQLAQIATTSGVAIAFYGGLIWRNYFEELNGGVACVSEKSLSGAYTFYLVGGLLHVAPTIVFILCYKFVYGWMRTDEEMSSKEEEQASKKTKEEKNGLNERAKKLLHKLETYLWF